MARGAFDARVVLDYYFPGVLPPPNQVPTDYRNSKEASEKLAAVLDASADKSAALRRYCGAHNNKDLAGTLTCITAMRRECRERAGGNRCDTRSVIYDTPAADYNSPNDGVI